MFEVGKVDKSYFKKFGLTDSEIKQYTGEKSKSIDGTLREIRKIQYPDPYTRKSRRRTGRETRSKYVPY